MSADFVTTTRADILEAFLGVEVKIEQIIATYYLGQPNNSMFVLFQMQVLRDSNCSFSLKRSVLNKILNLHFPGDKKANAREIESLHKLAKIRNYYAHCGSRFVYKPDETTRAIFTPDPDSPTKPLNFKEKHQTFMATLPQVNAWLQTLLAKMPEISKIAAKDFRTSLTSNLELQV